MTAAVSDTVIYDLAYSLHWSEERARAIFEKTRRTFLRHQKKNPYQKNETAFRLALVWRQISRGVLSQKKSLSAQERAMLDSQPFTQLRIKLLEAYLHRLGLPAQFALLAHYKHEITVADLAMALNESEPSLNLLLEQSLRDLAGWIWLEKSPDLEFLKSAIAKLKTSPPPMKEKKRFDFLKLRLPSAPVIKQRFPFWVRPLTEATVFSVLSLLLLNGGPHIENWLRRFETEHVPVGVAMDVEGESSELESFDSESDEASEGGLPGGEIWRFAIRTVDMVSLSKNIEELLADDFKTMASNTRAISAPGGTQFDFFLPKDKLAEFRTGLSRIVEKDPLLVSLAKEQKQEIFNWYKTISKKGIPAGQLRVVIWISQI